MFRFEVNQFRMLHFEMNCFKTFCSHVNHFKVHYFEVRKKYSILKRMSQKVGRWSVICWGLHLLKNHVSYFLSLFSSLLSLISISCDGDQNVWLLVDNIQDFELAFPNFGCDLIFRSRAKMLEFDIFFTRKFVLYKILLPELHWLIILWVVYSFHPNTPENTRSMIS